MLTTYTVSYYTEGTKNRTIFLGPGRRLQEFRTLRTERPPSHPYIPCNINLNKPEAPTRPLLII
jgi:hypothetical protein